MIGKTKPNIPTETKLRRITELSGEDSGMEYNCLMPHFNEESLTRCFYELDGKKAVGIDQQTKEEYGKNLPANIKKLVSRMKSMAYIPSPVREVLIPKGNRGLRPLGISNFEDKIVQLMMSKVLEAIYEPIFHDFSFGFRRGRSCHQAVKSCLNHLFAHRAEVVIDVDLENFFGSIDHKKLVAILRMKIKDERFIKYIVRMLKAGVLSDGDLKRSDEGTPQGSVASPVLANIFAHYALDEWFAHKVGPNTANKTAMYRYCDDLVICCKKRDAERITKSLQGRMERFSLKINEDKTKVVAFEKTRVKVQRQGTFDFLGFTFYLGTAKNGRTIVPKLRTSRKRFKSKLKVVRIWCKSNRHRHKMPVLWGRFCAKLRGHNQYYGVSFNQKGIRDFNYLAIKCFFEWMNRRGQKKSFTWEGFNKFLAAHPPPPVLVHHNMFGGTGK